MNIDHSALTVPGFTAVRRLGTGSQSETVLARNDTTGQVVVLKRLRHGGQQGTVDKAAAALTAFTHPGVVRLQSIRADGEHLILMTDYAGGGDLSQMLIRRGRLTPNETVRLIVSVGETLLAAHRAGLVHGAVNPHNVLLSETGLPLLGDLGTAQLMGKFRNRGSGQSGFTDPIISTAGAVSSASDVYSLAAVAFLALLGELPIHIRESSNHALQLGVTPALIQALSNAMAEHPADRPSLSDFLASVQAACPEIPEVIELTSVEPRPVTPNLVTQLVTPKPSLHQSAMPSIKDSILSSVMATVKNLPTGLVLRLSLIIAVIAVAIAIAVAWSAFTRDGTEFRNSVALATPPPSKPAPVGATSTPRTPSQWTALLVELDEKRSAAFTQKDIDLLRTIYTANSPMSTVDKQNLHTLKKDKVTAEGVRHDIQVLTIVSSKDDIVTVKTRDAMRSYLIYDHKTTPHIVPATQPHELLVTLQKEAHQWKIHQIQPVS